MPICKLAHEQNIKPFHKLALQARRVNQRRETDSRAQIGEQVKILPKPQQPGFRALVMGGIRQFRRSEEHTSELQSIISISYAVFYLKNNKHTLTNIA